MTEPEEPTRWKHGAADAPDGFADLARADAHGGPSDAALSRVIDKLALQVSAPEIARAFHDASGAGTAHAGALRSASSARFGLVWKLLAATCVLGAIAIGLFGRDASRRAQPPPPAANTVATEPTQPHPAAPSTPPATGTAAVPKVAAPEPTATPSTATATPTPARRPIVPPADPAAELRLLELAQQALRNDPARALAITEQHRQRFAHGQFAQEREMLAIEALVALGQRDRAEARARAFSRRYPDSSHLPHLRDLVHMSP